MLSDLRGGVQTARELQNAYGPSYISLLRKLKMKGHPIWKTARHGEVLYRLDEEGYPILKCRLCGRLSRAAPSSLTAKHGLCADCLASQGILSALQNRMEKSDSHDSPDRRL